VLVFPVPPLIVPVPLPFRLPFPALRSAALHLYGVIQIAPLRGLFACGEAAVFYFFGGVFFFIFLAKPQKNAFFIFFSSFFGCFLRCFLLISRYFWLKNGLF